MATPALYFDGHRSHPHPVVIHFDDIGNLSIKGGRELSLHFPFAGITVAPRLGNTPRALHLPDGGLLEVADNDLIDDLLRRLGGHRNLVHRLESRRLNVLLAFVVTAIGTALFALQGIPLIARAVAFSLPLQGLASLQEEGLDLLDRLGFVAPTRLPPARQEEVREIFARVAASIEEGGHSLRLELREGKRLGTNAVALPPRTIVVTDQLVELVKDDRELLAIFAHEAGHHHQRHHLRHLLEGSFMTALVVFVSGDLSAVNSLLATVPTWVLQLKYSRDFETEADRFATDFLLAAGEKPDHLATILLRLEAAGDEEAKTKPEEGGESASPITSYLSTHPETAARAAAILEASRAAAATP
ncbi:MAG: M48 family metallopeptidase [Magnetococcales bacterium]|nr:M48 family metallopeptidase [Magnetococcales bacterium]